MYLWKKYGNKNVVNESGHRFSRHHTRYLEYNFNKRSSLDLPSKGCPALSGGSKNNKGSPRRESPNGCDRRWTIDRQKLRVRSQPAPGAKDSFNHHWKRSPKITTDLQFEIFLGSDNIGFHEPWFLLRYAEGLSSVLSVSAPMGVQ